MKAWFAKWFWKILDRMGLVAWNRGGTRSLFDDPPQHFNCRCAPPPTIEAEIDGVKLTLRKFPGLGPPPSPTGFPSTERLVDIVRMFDEKPGFKMPLGPTENSWILVDGNGCCGPALRFRERPEIGEVTVGIVEKLDGSIPFPYSAVTCGSCGRNLMDSDLSEKWLMKEMR